MAGIQTVFQCLFCTQTFGTAAAKDDHILEHFAQETCSECDQKLLRIGNNLYTLHNAVTCVKIQAKNEHCHSSDAVESNINPTAIDLLAYDEDAAEFDIDMAANDFEFKSESIQYDETDQNTFESYVESAESRDSDEQEDIADKEHNKSISTAPANDAEQSSSSASVFHTKCGICSKLFTTLTELNTHIERVHMSTDGFQCDICFKRVKSQTGLNVHKRVCHDEANIWKFQCKQCDAPFMKKSALQEHQCGDNLTGKLKCELCGKEGFPTALALKCHVAFMHKDDPDTANHICKTCRKKCASACDLDKHKLECSYVRNIRVSKRCGELWCELCMTKFDDNALLRKHIQMAHGKCKKFECNSCCAVFFKQATYDKHFCVNPMYKSRKANTERAPCEICGKVLYNRSVLEKHKIVIHGSSTLSCSLCARRSKTQEEHDIHRTECALKKKMRRYRRYECNECDFISKSQVGLRVHVTKTHKVTDNINLSPKRNVM